MYLLVGSLPANDQRDLQPLLESMGLNFAGDEPMQQWLAAAGNAGAVTLAQETERLFASSTVMPLDLNESAPLVGSAMEQLESAQALIFHARPETVLLRAMEEDSSPMEALHSWRVMALQVLEIYRQNRGRVMLVSSEAVRDNPAEFAQACSKHLGLQVTTEKALHSGDVRSSQQDIHRLVAAQMIAQSPEVEGLVLELEASSVPMGEHSVSPAIDCEQAYRQLQEMTASKPDEKTEQELNDAREENELLLLQLHQVQEELETYFVELRKTTDKCAVLESDQLAIREELSDCRKQLSDCRKQVEKEKAALKETHAVLVSDRDRIQLLLDEKKQLWQDLSKARNMLARVRASHSWKITRPLRALNGLFRRKLKHQDGGAA